MSNVPDLDEEATLVWAEEAERRAQAMEDGREPEIPAEEVFARVRTLVEEVQQARREYKAGLGRVMKADDLLKEILS